MIAKQERKRMKIQAAMAEPEDIIFVDDATGNDKKGEGTEKKPYKTIGRALEVAESEDTIKVGPGVYSESFWITTLDRITLEGSGRDSTTIDGHVWADWCKEFMITGFTIKGDPDYLVGVWCWDVAYARIADCLIDCPYYEGTGIIAEHTALMQLVDSQIKNTGEEGIGVDAASSSTVNISRCIIEENGYGVWVSDSASVRLWNSEVKNSDWYGFTVRSNGKLWLQRSSIHNNYLGIHVSGGGVVDSRGSENQIFRNTDAGIYLGPGGLANLASINIYENHTGICVSKASTLILRSRGIIITNNDLGIEVREFAHAFLENNSIDGNTLDVYIHIGGQAICNPGNIGIIRSDCPYCQHEPTGSQRP
jgi:hypothetical protein